MEFGQFRTDYRLAYGHSGFREQAVGLPRATDALGTQFTPDKEWENAKRSKLALHTLTSGVLFVLRDIRGCFVECFYLFN